MYKCICGKEFDKPNSFNAHKSHCKEHYLNKYGDLNYFNESNKARSIKAEKTKAINYNNKQNINNLK